MELGVLIFPTDRSIAPDELARAAEDRGLVELWVTEHTHLPTNHSPWPGGPVLPEEYKRTLDPFVALTAAAAVTTKLRLGTGVCLVAQHDPISLAKTVASLDHVSNGRFDLGIGVGWNVPEMQHHGVDPKRRYSIVRDKIRAMKALWADDVASYDGEFVSFSDSWSWPKPVQRPHPKVLIGGGARPVTFRHIVEEYDGWMPIAGRDDFLADLAGLRQQWADGGRDPKAMTMFVFGASPDPAFLEKLAASGVQQAILGVPPAPSDKVLPILDGYAKLVAQGF